MYPNVTRRCAIVVSLLMIHLAPAANAQSAPPPGDILGRFIVHKARMEGSALHIPSHATERLRFLANARSSYSRLDLKHAGYEGDAWYAARDHMYREGLPMRQSDAIIAMAWDFGMTRASEVWEIPVSSGWGGVDVLARTQAVKAGLDEDVYLQARKLWPRTYVAVTANYAVAAMLLRERLTLANTYDRRVAAGLDDRVLQRFLAATGPQGVSASDAAYLMLILEGEFNRWHAGHLSNQGGRQLPLPFRLARAAAAFRDDLGYLGYSPCVKDASGLFTSVSGESGGSQWPCLVDMTDQDLHVWYRQMYRREMPETSSAGAHKHLLDSLREVHPLWVPMLRPWALSEAHRVEVAEHLAVREGPLDGRSLAADDVLSRRVRKVVMEVAKP